MFCLLDQERKEFIDSFFTREKKPENRLKFRRRSSRSLSVQPEILDEVVRTAVIIKRVFMVSLIFKKIQINQFYPFITYFLIKKK